MFLQFKRMGQNVSQVTLKNFKRDKGLIDLRTRLKSDTSLEYSLNEIYTI